MRLFSRRFVAVQILGLVAISMALAQSPQKANEPVPTFRANTRVVEVSVFVTDRNAPVLNLTKEDFAVRDNGKPQPIAFFTAPRNEASKGPSEPRINNVNASLGSAVIVLDWLNTPIDNQLYARIKTLSMLEQINVHDQIALAVNHRQLKMLHDFTGDTEALIESVRALRGSVDAPDAPLVAIANSRVMALDIWQTKGLMGMRAIDSRIRADATYDSMGQILKVLAGRPGRRSVIWVSNGLPLPFDTLERLQANNIALYLINARGLGGRPLPDPRNPGRMNLSSTRGPIDDNIFTDVVERTGGRYYVNRNDLDGAMREALDETRQSYTLSYYAPADARIQEGDLKWATPNLRQIRIEVPKGKYSLRYRKAYDPSWIGR